MTEDSKAIAATVTGAVIGGLAGYLFFTERGRAMRRSLEPMLEDLARELSSFGVTVHKAANVAAEGWKLLNGALEGRQAFEYSSPRQSSPF